MANNDISVFGLVINIVASNTFPVGFNLTQFSDDADPVDMPSVKIGDAVLGVNGDLIGWNKAVPLPVTISVIPGSTDDVNLSILANANRAAQGKVSARDIITMTLIYPDGTTIIFSTGKLTDSTFGKSGSSQGRLKTRPYAFLFQSNTGT